MVCVTMNFKHTITKALKGRNFASLLITPFQGSNSRVYPFHRALPDAIAKRLSALTTITSCLFFITNHQ